MTPVRRPVGLRGGMRRVFITVAEVSADRHAAELAKSLKALDPGIVVEGHGGSAMREAGVVVHHETVQRATMLVRAVLRGWEFWRLIRWTRRHFRQNRPDVHVCIDSSGINLHFAKMAHGVGVPVLYYIAPQLWASREGRIAKVQKYVDRVACILPFEEKYYKKWNVNATFVGHPLFDELPADRKLSPEPVAFTAERPPVVGLMPGSRRAEVRANLPRMFEVAERIKQAYPGVRFEIPTTPPTHELVTQMTAGRPDVRIERNGIDAMAPGWDFCLAKSGTTTLHLAAYGVPMIVVYYLTKLAWNVVGRWMIKTPSIALVNILAERSPSSSPVPKYRIVPEVVPWNGPVTPVAELAVKLLGDVEKRREQRRDLLNLVADLDRHGASRHAAEIAMGMMKR